MDILNMDSEDILKEKRNHLKTWLVRHKKAQDVTPYIQKNLELTEWELKAVRDCPQEIKGSYALLRDDFRIDLEHTKKTLPMMPDYNKVRIADSTAISSAGTSVVFGFVSDARNLGTPEAIEYSEKYSRMYVDLQASKDQPKEARKLLEKLKKPETLALFDKAERAYLLFKAGTGERTAVALQLRNLLDGIKGDLFKYAYRQSRENMTWKIMADRLVKGDIGGTEHFVIIGGESVRSELIDKLSSIAKEREGEKIKDIGDIWTRVLDHIYAVLSLVNIRP